MAQWPDHDELLAAIRDAGWLLEHHAVRVLEAAEMHPRSGWAYQDADDPTASRELDVWSHQRVLAHEASKIYVTARFLVECKQSSLPYVGIGRDLPDWKFRGNPTQHVLPRKEFRVDIEGRPGSYRLSPAWDHLALRELAKRYGETNFRVTQLTRLDRGNGGAWKATNSGIFTQLVYPLAKALRASQEPLLKSRQSAMNSRNAKGTRQQWLDLGLHFPVVLISCPLYVVNATEEDPAVKQVPWTTAVRELKSKNVSGTFEIDIVTESAFAEYVKHRMAFACGLADSVAADPTKYTGDGQPGP